MSVTTGGGGGHQLEAPYICKGFQWTLENVCFIADVIVLPLACCELILRVQQLKSLGQIVWNFDKLHMEFTIERKKVALRGAKKICGQTNF